MHHFSADDGESIHLDIVGHGTPIVLLHGWTSSHQEWFPFLSGLSAQHKVYRWDARGHGGHPLKSGNMPTVERMAADLANLIDHYQLEDPVIIGHSMGALTLWQYIRDYGTSRLGKVGFIDQSPKLMTDADWSFGVYGDFDRERAISFAAELHADFPETVLRLAANGLNERAREKYQANASGWQKSRAWLQQLPPAPLIACWQSLVEADYRDLLEHIDRPALLIYGDSSNFYNSDTRAYIAKRFRDAVLHVYEGADHSPHQWQRKRFVRDVLNFIDG